MTVAFIQTLLWRLFTLAVVVFMITPIVLVVLFSFNQSALTSLPLTGLTLDWYRRLFAEQLFLAGAAEQPHRRLYRGDRFGRDRNAGRARSGEDAGARGQP